MRADSIAKTPHGLLGRGVAGIARLDARREPPGLDRAAAATGSRSCSPALDHALELLADEQTEHVQT